MSHEKNKRVRQQNGKSDKDRVRYLNKNSWDINLDEKMMRQKNIKYFSKIPHKYLLGSDTVTFLGRFAELEAVHDIMVRRMLLKSDVEDMTFNLQLEASDESDLSICVEVRLSSHLNSFGRKIQITEEHLQKITESVYLYGQPRTDSYLFVKICGLLYRVQLTVVADISILDTSEVLFINRGVTHLHLEGTSEGFRYNVLGGILMELDLEALDIVTTVMSVDSIKEKELLYASSDILARLEVVGEEVYSNSCAFSGCKLHLFGEYKKVSGILYTRNRNKLFPVRANEINHENWVT